MASRLPFHPTTMVLKGGRLAVRCRQQHCASAAEQHALDQADPGSTRLPFLRAQSDEQIRVAGSAGRLDTGLVGDGIEPLQVMWNSDLSEPFADRLFGPVAFRDRPLHEIGHHHGTRAGSVSGYPEARHGIDEQPAEMGLVAISQHFRERQSQRVIGGSVEVNQQILDHGLGSCASRVVRQTRSRLASIVPGEGFRRLEIPQTGHGKEARYAKAAAP